MKISTPLKWHGGKHYLAPHIIRLMPPHIHYVEPFAGGLSVLLAKNPEGFSEIVNDLHGDLTNFWTVLQNEPLFQRFKRLVEAIPFSQTEYQDAKKKLATANPGDFLHVGGPFVVRAAWFFIACRQSLAGRMKGFTGITKTRVRRGMNNEVSAWLTCIQGLPQVHERLKRVLILNEPALDVIRKQDGKDTLFYLDPPYLHKTRATTGEYAHEMSDAQHVELIEALAKIEGKFMLSGYRSVLYDAHANYTGWRRVDFDVPNNSAGGKKKQRKTECVWTNYDPSTVKPRPSAPPRSGPAS
jgi:DNA adenine methylase